MTTRNETKEFASNTSWLIVQRIYTMLVSLVVGSLSARYLGPSNLGLINYGSSLVLIFTTVSQLGLGNVLVAEFVRQPSRRGSLMGAALVMRLAASFLSIFCVTMIIRVMEPDNTLLQIVTILQAISIVFQTNEVFNFYFQSQLQSKYYVWAVMLATTIVGGWRIWLLITNKSVEWFALSSSINAFVILAFTGVALFLTCRPRLSVSFSDIRFLFSNSYHFVISSIASILYQQMDRIMIGKMIGEVWVGFYSPAATIAELWEFFPLAIISSAAPIIYNEYNKDQQSALRKIQILFCGLTLLGIGVATFFTLFGKYFVLLLYGEAFAASTPLLSILIWGTVMAIINCVRTVWIVANNYNRYMKYFACIGAAVNFLCNYFWIPQYGAAGAAVAMIVTQSVVFFSSILFAPTRPVIKLFFNSFQHIGEATRSCIHMMKSVIRPAEKEKTDEL